MKSMTIESANKERNTYMLWLALGWTVANIPLLLPLWVFPSWGWILFISSGILILTVAGIKTLRLNRQIKKSPQISRALTQELFLVYERKAYRAGFITLLAALAISTVICDVTEIPAKIIYRWVFFTGIFSYLISWLIFNRD